ncbi:hypothetical protein [Sphingobacterium sp. UGAL515B_05]|uniref:hypothetical protein n=1 Tax=Sphingobacterium sp. UGAL515B_05 TaxID=2986767 RepID=UPI0029532D7E|nr:hypothetical protein [Sphingobacterium sp. UGAL515B_05]WON93097.1 hypothetical protein OK025_17805 [Sphingobacterium sp. UGAL515B_05]
MGKLRLLIMNVLIVFFYGACQLPQRPPQSSTNESKRKAEELPSNVTFFGGGRSKEMNMVSGKTDTIFISVHQADSVLIKIKTPTDTANVRISQLFLPNGSADGPFGQELAYRFKDVGQYHITVNENKMVGNHYSGPYVVQIVPIVQ